MKCRKRKKGKKKTRLIFTTPEEEKIIFFSPAKLSLRERRRKKKVFGLFSFATTIGLFPNYSIKNVRREKKVGVVCFAPTFFEFGRLERASQADKEEKESGETKKCNIEKEKMAKAIFSRKRAFEIANVFLYVSSKWEKKAALMSLVFRKPFIRSNVQSKH